VPLLDTLPRSEAGQNGPARGQVEEAHEACVDGKNKQVLERRKDGPIFGGKEGGPSVDEEDQHFEDKLGENDEKDDLEGRPQAADKPVYTVTANKPADMLCGNGN
jgi:hypothetical protein